MKGFLPVLFLMIFCFGCIKNDKGCTDQKPEVEEPAILAFIAANNIQAQKHAKGIYYEIVTKGYNPIPVATSTLVVNYTGKFLDGTIFNSPSTPVTLNLGNVIEGWQIGLPLIGKGGKIRLVIPSAFAYGCNGYKNIPSNSVLYFEVELLDVK